MSSLLPGFMSCVHVLYACPICVSYMGLILVTASISKLFQTFPNFSKLLIAFQESGFYKTKELLQAVVSVSGLN